MALVDLADAQDHVLGRVVALPAVEVPVSEARGLVVAADVVSPDAIPPFANTAMDGFAVRAADTEGASDDQPVRLDVTGTLAAGADPSGVRVEPGQAVRIMTGAALPDGADAVVMVERTRADGDRLVWIEAAARPGDHVRAAGDDVEPGQVVLATGAVLGPPHLGVLASIGVARVAAVPRPRVGVLSTGDELVEGPRPLRPGEIRDSNRPMLLAALDADGFEAVDLGLVRDDERAIAAALERGLARCDALLTSGGVSVGDFDYVRVVLDRMGDMRWMQVAIKPAKPLAFGVVGGRPVFGLPGNPVSSGVSYELFARPALRRMAGRAAAHWHRQRRIGVAAEALRRHRDGKVHFLRVAVERGAGGRLEVRPLGGQGSHQLLALADADALAVVADGDGVAAGDAVELIPLDDRL